MRLSKRRFLAAAGGTLMAGLRHSAAQGAQAVAFTARKASLTLPGMSSADGLSFDGTANGPVLRLAKGAALDLRLTNGLDAPFALQWHGMRAPNAEDGDWPRSGELLMPGATRSIGFTPPDSGLYWFHPAPLPGQPDLTAQGLRGVLIVEDAAPPTADHDVVVTLADWRLAEDKSGPFTVNGAAAPAHVTVVPGARLRLRLVNASTVRPMIVGIEGARPLILAIDGQPSDLFEPVQDQVPVGPGARFEFMIDAPAIVGATVRFVTRGADAVAGTVLFEARTEGIVRTPLAPVAALARNEALSPAIPLERSTRADLRIEAATGPARFALNGRAGLDPPAKPLLTVRRGGTVTLGFDNRTKTLVAVRVHGHVLRLLHAKDDGWEPYWRDSVILLPGSVTHVAFVADNPGRWLLESALFDQAAFGLRHWFEVT